MYARSAQILVHCVFAVLITVASFGVALSQDCSCVPNQVIVQLTPAASLTAVAAQYGLNPTPISQVASPAIYLLQITNGQTPTQVVSAMNGDTRIIFREVNRKLSQVEREGLPWTQGRSWAIGRSWATGGSARGYARQWFPHRIRLNEAFAAAGTRGLRVDNGQPIVVAVLDTGIDLTHPAFAGKLVPQSDRWDFVDGDNDPSEVGVLYQNPSYGHGTHVAGIVALTVPDAKIMPLRILGPDGSGELWRITAGLIWAAAHGADVANLSIGYPEDVRVLHDLLDCVDVGSTVTGTTFPEIGTRRLAVAVASGNGMGTAAVFPAAERRDGMLAVGASTRYDDLAAFSTYDRQWVKVTAPGEEIVSALPGGRYGMWSGTSMSAPIVAGVIALVKARFPTSFATPHDLLGQVKETSVDKRFDNVPPWGEVRLKRVDALCAVTNNQACPIPANNATTSGFENFLVK